MKNEDLIKQYQKKVIEPKREEKSQCIDCGGFPWDCRNCMDE